MLFPPKEILTLKAGIEASNATEKAIFEVLKDYLDEVKSYGDELDIEPLCDEFKACHKKNKWGVGA